MRVREPRRLGSVSAAQTGTIPPSVPVKAGREGREERAGQTGPHDAGPGDWRNMYRRYRAGYSGARPEPKPVISLDTWSGTIEGGEKSGEKVIVTPESPRRRGRGSRPSIGILHNIVHIPDLTNFDPDFIEARRLDNSSPVVPETRLGPQPGQPQQTAWITPLDSIEYRQALELLARGNLEPEQAAQLRSLVAFTSERLVRNAGKAEP